MIKFYNSLQFRLTASFVLFIFVISLLVYTYTYNEAKKALKETVREELIEVTAMAATQIKGQEVDDILSLKPGDETSGKFKQIVEHLAEMRKNSKDLTNFYIMTIEGKKVVFLVDDLILTDDDGAKIGEEYTDYDDAVLLGKEKPIATKDFYTDKWGTFLSGFAPIADKSGKIVAVLGLDISVEKVLKKQHFLGSLIYIIIGVAIFFASLIILFFSGTIIKDLNKMTKVADKISNGELNFSLPVINSQNEIHALNESLKSVIAAVEFLKDTVKSGK